MTAGRTRFRFPPRPFVLAAAGLAALLGVWRFASPSREALAVYCAHDSVYSERVLSEFEGRTGIPVSIRFDTEATKSLGLVELLKAERARPRSDVFWNNELLGTLDLMEEGLLEPYRGPGWDRIPAAFKDPDGRWAGFGARMRVVVVNTGKGIGADAASVERALAGDLSRAAIAKPMYGTTLTHYAVLWDLLGPEGLKTWHADWRKRGVREVSGNAAVKNLVAEGVCDLGLTDTDDFFVALDAGKPVAMTPVRVGGDRVILVPNTVAIVKGTRRLEAARRLVDFLLSEESETLLARSASRQVPLGPVPLDRLPPEVRDLGSLVSRGYPLAGLGPARRACLAWLKSEATH